MSSHLSLELHDASQVGEARRAATRLAQDLGFGEESTGRAALVATELSTNLVRHAMRGRLLLAARRDLPGGAGVEMLSLDDGPGMPDLAACRRDGYSSAGTPGNGLGAIERMSDEFSIISTAGRGTIAVARVFAERLPTHGGSDGAFRVGGLATCKPGETVCGDAYAVKTEAQLAAVLMADGLGHGPGAAEAAQAAVKVFNGAATGTAPSQVIDRSHAALRATRGAALAVALLDAARGTLVFAGAGNIAARIISGVGDRSLLSQHGTVGLQVRRIQDASYEWPEHALVVLHSDGIETRWTLADAPGLLQCDPLVIAAWLLREHARGRDDATVVVIRRA